MLALPALMGWLRSWMGCLVGWTCSLAGCLHGGMFRWMAASLETWVCTRLSLRLGLLSGWSWWLDEWVCILAGAAA
jgi:hypothetical protein